MNKTMELNEAMASLTTLCKGKPWFHDVTPDQYGRPVVYVLYQCEETLHDFIPDHMGGHQVLVHFAASKLMTRDNFVDHGDTSLSRLKVPALPKVPLDNFPIDLIQDITDEAELVEEDKSVRHLVDELDKLEKQCGSNILQDIFYEVHDGPNAVTNLSAKFPEVRRGMERLYKLYGFDVIYEELDG
jgi:hypothetical protein